MVSEYTCLVLGEPPYGAAGEAAPHLGLQLSRLLRLVQVVDDFLRNFLLKMGMTSTLDCFETEWYELAATGQLKSEDVSTVPDVYLRNQELDDLAKVSLR